MTTRSLRELTVGELVAAVGARTAAPASGAVAALTTALALGLVCMAARFSTTAGAESSRCAELLARAEQLRQEVEPLADADVAAYSAFLTALRMAPEPDADSRRARIAQTRSQAVDVPLATAEIAAEGAQLAAELAVSGNQNLRGDAATAVFLCRATALAAAVMVSENLGSDSVDPRIQQARSACLAAGEAARRTLRLFPAADQSSTKSTT